jgi:serine/threonine protein kinase
MGEVWLAEDQALGRTLALKFVATALVDDEGLKADLRNETRIGLRLSHPSIVRIYDFLCDENFAAIAMEYVEGRTLSSLRVAQSEGVFEFDQILPWLSAICAAMKYAHEEVAIIHRDLKPSNVMVTPDNRVKIMDFGLSHSVNEAMARLTLSRNPAGTLVYMSPQQAMGQRPQVSDDIYSMGAMIFELLTGRPPFHSGDIFVQLRNLVPLSMTERRKEMRVLGEPIPQHVEKVVAACLSKDPAQRPSSMHELLALLTQSAEMVSRQLRPTELPHLAPPSLAPRSLNLWQRLWLRVKRAFARIPRAEEAKRGARDGGQTGNVTPSLPGHDDATQVVRRSVTVVGDSSRRSRTGAAAPETAPTETAGGHLDDHPTLIQFPSLQWTAPEPPPAPEPPKVGRFEADEITLSPYASIRRFPSYPLLVETDGRAREVDHPEGATKAPPSAPAEQPTIEPFRTDFPSRDERKALAAFEEAFAHLQQGELEAAAEAYKRASDSGHHIAERQLAWLRESSPNWPPPNQAETERLLESITIAHGQCLFDEARNHERGVGRKQDLTGALRLYRQAAELNHPDAVTRLGLLHLHGRGVERDPGTAAAFFSRAAEQRHGPALLQLGRLYEKGLGTQRNWTKACACFEHAAALGEELAADKLDHLRDRMAAPGKEPLRKPGHHTVPIPPPSVPDEPPIVSVAENHIFMSYCRKDAKVVHDISDLLKQKGFSIWVDVADAEGVGGIPAADSWPDAIVQQIRRSRLLVCMVSSYSVQSPNVQNEVGLARQYDVKIVPAFLEELKPENLPDFFQYHFARIQYLPLQRHLVQVQADRLSRVLERLLKAR